MNYKLLEVAEKFQIEVPQDARYELSEDTTTFAVRFATEPVTELLASCFPLNDSTAQEAEAKVEQAVRMFCGRVVPQVLEQGTSFDVRTTFNSETGMHVSQGVILLDDGPKKCWIVRGCWKHGLDGFYLLHWNGLYSDLRATVLKVLESFRIKPGELNRDAPASGET